MPVEVFFNERAVDLYFQLIRSCIVEGSGSEGRAEAAAAQTIRHFRMHENDGALMEPVFEKSDLISDRQLKLLTLLVVYYVVGFHFSTQKCAIFVNIPLFIRGFYDS